MKIRMNEQNQIEIKFGKDKYKLLFHRIAYGKHECYIKDEKSKLGIRILNSQQRKKLKEYIEKINIKEK